MRRHPKIRSRTTAGLVLLAALGAAETPGAVAAAAATEAPPRVVKVRIDSVIHPVAADFVVETLAAADQSEVAAVVIELNTPGGLVSSTREITTAILSARTPVVVYVAPSGAQAASAGFYVLMAADVAAMAPGTNTGAAHPVGGQGEDIEGTLGKKVEEDAAANVRSLARRHGRNVELAQAAVVESRSFAADEALAEGLIELVAPDLTALLAAVDGREVAKGPGEPWPLRTAGALVEEREMSAVQRFLAAIARPEIATILMALGMLGLYMELSHPGTLLPGIVGAICLILGLFAMSVLPISYAGVGLLLLALVLFFAETQVPTFGALTLGGAVALTLGLMMLFKSADPALRLGVELIAAVVAGILLVIVPLSIKTARVRRGRVTTGKEGLVGERGVVRSDLAPRGKIFVHGELWHAVAEEPLAAGTPVEVAAVDGLTLRVRKLP